MIYIFININHKIEKKYFIFYLESYNIQFQAYIIMIIIFKSIEKNIFRFRSLNEVL